MLNVEKCRQGENWEELNAPASGEDHEYRGGEKANNNEPAVLQNVSSNVGGNAVASFESGLEFGIEGSGNSGVFEEDVRLEDETESDEKFSKES
jgi:hypothetical protein